MKDVVILHESFNQVGGAERVAIEIAKIFPDAKLISLTVSSNLVYTDLPISRIRELFPFLAKFHIKSRLIVGVLGLLAFPLFKSNDQTVICSSIGLTHLIKSDRKVIYCYSPARWLYEPENFTSSLFLSIVIRTISFPIKWFDRKRASESALIFAISRNTQERISKYWKLDSQILNPPVKFTEFSPTKKPTKLKFQPKEYFLTVSRPRLYKNTNVVTSAFQALVKENLVVVGISDFEDQENIQFLSNLTDEEICWLYKNAKAVIAISREDFGLTPIEGHVFGTPSIVLGDGGYLESCIEAENAILIPSSTEKALREAVVKFKNYNWNAKTIKQSALRFSTDTFSRKLVGAIQRSLH